MLCEKDKTDWKDEHDGTAATVFNDRGLAEGRSIQQVGALGRLFDHVFTTNCYSIQRLAWQDVAHVMSSNILKVR